MSKWDKLLEKVRTLSSNLRFEELQKILEGYGYKLNRNSSGSSHYTFRKKDCAPITIPKHEPIKIIYIKMVRDIVENEEANKNENN